MRAIGVTRYGGPEVLEMIDLPTALPGSGRVRIRVAAAAVAPVDAMLREGMLADDSDEQPPFVPGKVAGVIDGLGAGVTESDLVVGEMVIGFVDSTGVHGGYSDYVVLPTASVTTAALDPASTVILASPEAECAEGVV